MNPLSSLPPLSPYSSTPQSSTPQSSAAPSVRESRNTGKANGEPPSETGSRAVRAAASSERAGGLEEAELKELTELKARDREVRAHEAAHQATGGQYSGAMSLTYQRGPDGAQYAVGGEVSISMSSVDGNPQATIEKMRTVRAAAMAPAQPSSQDRAVAAQAMQAMLQAQSELALEQESANPLAKASASDSEDTSSGSQENAAERPSRVAQQAKNTYQNIAGFVPD